MKDNWIKDVIKKPGALKKALGIKKGEKSQLRNWLKLLKPPEKWVREHG